MARCGVGSAGSESSIRTGGSATDARAYAAFRPRGPGNVTKHAAKARRKEEREAAKRASKD